jgi:N-acetyl-1-D-myo-inositol-2-amino-2-deoxy-alpha-D-glucopyranoside deacetylase
VAVIDRTLSGRTVLGIFAHPDDESLACGGTLARLSDAGARVVLICASSGRRGSVSDPALVPDGDLGRVRTAELREAAAVLGIADVVVLDHPDGNLRWADVPEFHAEILSAIDTYRPDAVITFAEDGLYWHFDHVAVHERTCTALRSLGDDAPALYYVTMPQGVMRGVVETAIAKGGMQLDAGFWGIGPDAFGSAARRPSFVVDVRDWVPRKLAALLRHRTQMGPANPFSWIDEDDARRLLGTEQFRRARPHTGESLLEALGEPLLRSHGRSRT